MTSYWKRVWWEDGVFHEQDIPEEDMYRKTDDLQPTLPKLSCGGIGVSYNVDSLGGIRWD